ncbi:MAG TPA: PaaI family thioesterase [Acidimicrobiia bacterium]
MTQAPTGQYPPPEHILRDLRLSVEHRPDGTSTAWIPVTPHVCNPSGSPRAGVLAILVDVVGGGLAAVAVRPDWIATADLTLHLIPSVVTGEIEARGRVVRQGRTTVVVEVALGTSDGASLGLATMSFAVLPHRAENLSIDQVERVNRMTMATNGSGLRDAFHERVQLAVVDAATGAIELPRTDYILNSMGAVQGGMVAAVADAAAVAAIGHAVGGPVESVDLQITYLALAKVGPIRTRSAVLSASETFGSAHVEIVDTGAGNRLTTVARVVATRP